MQQIYITQEKLLAWLDSDPGDVSVIGGHIRNCEMCARHVADERLLRCLLKWKRGRATKYTHIDDETLAAYAEERLSPSQMRAVSAHLVECDRCLLDLIDLRYMIHVIDEIPPEDEYLSATNEYLSQLLQHWLGHIEVTLKKIEPTVRWRPSAIAHPAPFKVLSEAERRRVDIEWVFEPKMEAYIERPAPPRYSKQIKERSINIKTSEYRISISVEPDADRAKINVVVGHLYNDSPIHSLQVVLNLPDDDTLSANTDGTGLASFLVGQGEFELCIGHGPIWRLSISVGADSQEE